MPDELHKSLQRKFRRYLKCKKRTLRKRKLEAEPQKESNITTTKSGNRIDSRFLGIIDIFGW